MTQHGLKGGETNFLLGNGSYKKNTDLQMCSSKRTKSEGTNSSTMHKTKQTKFQICGHHLYHSTHSL